MHQNHFLPEITFYGHCLIKSNISIRKNVINLYISYTLTPWLRNLNYFTLNNCSFGSAKLNKNADSDKYKYSGCGIGRDSCSKFLFTDRNIGRNVIAFGADMSLSVQKIKIKIS